MLTNEKDLPNDSVAGKFFSGTVKAHDTEKKLRLRVHVEDLMQGWADEDCPWAGMGRPLMRGSMGAAGFYSVPRIGSRVLVMFDKGSIDSPIVLMELPDGQSTPATLGENYPNRYGWEDENGNYLYFDVQTKFFKMKNQGATVTIKENSDVVVDTPASVDVTAGQHVHVSAGAEVNVTAASSMTLTAQGPIAVQSATQVSLSAPSVSMGSGPVTISSDTVVNIVAPSINLNP